MLNRRLYVKLSDPAPGGQTKGKEILRKEREDEGAGNVTPKSIIKGRKLLPGKAIRKTPAYPAPSPACLLTGFHRV